MAFKRVRQRLKEAAAITCEEEKGGKVLEDGQTQEGDEAANMASRSDSGELNFIPLVNDDDDDDDDGK